MFEPSPPDHTRFVALFFIVGAALGLAAGTAVTAYIILK
jgi:phage shock protein PspC (stress-responsive transcriptional regulator)